jgi:hypothetical protein
LGQHRKNPLAGRTPLLGKNFSHPRSFASSFAFEGAKAPADWPGASSFHGSAVFLLAAALLAALSGLLVLLAGLLLAAALLAALPGLLVLLVGLLLAAALLAALSTLLVLLVGVLVLI